MARWNRIDARGSVDDRRGQPGKAAAGGIGGIGVVGAIIVFLLSGGENFGPLLEQIGTAGSGVTAPDQDIDAGEFEGADDYEVFASTVLGSNDEAWNAIFTASGLTYEAPTLVLFRQATTSACGSATSSIGPHYCPADQTIYLDETFFDELVRRFGAAGGDVAEAYVIGHEVGHHVQTLLGINASVRETQQGASQAEANDLSVRMELQADCFAGVWASTLLNEGVFLPGELEEALDAAEAVGDDRIQEASGGRSNPESWTHGSSADRRAWLSKGLETGDASACDTFS